MSKWGILHRRTFPQRGHHRTLHTGIWLLGAILSTCALGTVFSPYDPLTMDMTNRLAPPSSAHWFGTDGYGRDVFSRTAQGAWIAFLVGSLPVGFGGVIGVLLGETSSMKPGNS